MKYHPLDHWQIPGKPRSVVRRGSCVRLTGGPTYGASKAPLTLRGKFHVKDIQATARGGTVCLEIVGLTTRAGTFVVRVETPPRTRFGINWRPYRVHLTKP